MNLVARRGSETAKSRRLGASETLEFSVEAASSPRSHKPDPAEAQRKLLRSVNTWLMRHPGATVLGMNFGYSWDNEALEGAVLLYLTVESVAAEAERPASQRSKRREPSATSPTSQREEGVVRLKARSNG
jgi:hypothetical protein